MGWQGWLVRLAALCFPSRSRTRTWPKATLHPPMQVFPVLYPWYLALPRVVREVSELQVHVAIRTLSCQQVRLPPLDPPPPSRHLATGS